MKIIGHRGAAGLAPENTIESIKAAIAAGVDAVEIDVRLSGDNSLVLSHGPLDSRDLPSPYLSEAIETAGDLPVMVEIKDHGSAKILALEIKQSQRPTSQWMVASFLFDELSQLKQHCPEVRLWPITYRHPIGIIRTARRLDAYGIGLNAWLLNPLTYWLSRHFSFKLMVYANTYGFIVNNPLAVRLLRTFYPDVIICTDRPDLIAPIVKG